jgi:hypothetical protein
METEIPKCNQRPKPDGAGDYFSLLPVFMGQLINSGDTAEYTDGVCFSKVKMFLEYNHLDDEGNFHEVDLHVVLSDKKSMFCSERFFFATTEKYHYEKFWRATHHIIRFKNLSEDDKLDIKAEGVRLFDFCDSIGSTLVSLVKTLKLFMGGLGANPSLPIIGSHVPAYMEKANIEFIKENLNIEIPLRKVNKRLEIDESLINSGDFFAVDRLDGLDEIIMAGTGSMSGHSVMALRIDGELHIVES